MSASSRPRPGSGRFWKPPGVARWVRRLPASGSIGFVQPACFSFLGSHPRKKKGSAKRCPRSDASRHPPPPSRWPRESVRNDLTISMRQPQAGPGCKGGCKGPGHWGARGRGARGQATGGRPLAAWRPVPGPRRDPHPHPRRMRRRRRTPHPRPRRRRPRAGGRVDEPRGARGQATGVQGAGVQGARPLAAGHWRPGGRYQAREGTLTRILAECVGDEELLTRVRAAVDRELVVA